MPFNIEALLELKEREDISMNQLVKNLGEFSEERGLEIKCSATLIYNWISKKAVPTIKSLDLLSAYAIFKGHFDLEFYKPLEEVPPLLEQSRPESIEKQISPGPLSYIKLDKSGGK